MLREVNWNIDKVKSSIQDENEIRNVTIIGRRFPNNNEIIIEIGAKNYWALLLREKTELVNQCLDEILQ
ncbi:MAG TPA: hypothetical protein VKA26_03865 [Ignavibacteriaceae bacterium]|nr:hypothetical protein [Ignavibacteriaceae bacterium]